MCRRLDVIPSWEQPLDIVQCVGCAQMSITGSVVRTLSRGGFCMLFSYKPPPGCPSLEAIVATGETRAYRKAKLAKLVEEMHAM